MWSTSALGAKFQAMVSGVSPGVTVDPGGTMVGAFDEEHPQSARAQRRQSCSARRQVRLVFFAQGSVLAGRSLVMGIWGRGGRISTS